MRRQHGRLDIPGGPIAITVTGVQHVRECGFLMGFWVVGDRSVQVVLTDGAALWTLTGRGVDRKPQYRGDLPTATVRRAFRDSLRPFQGEVVNPYATDHGKFDGRSRWGWDDSNSWRWWSADGAKGQMFKAAAVNWMRTQAKAVGVTIREDDE